MLGAVTTFTAADFSESRKQNDVDSVGVLIFSLIGLRPWLFPRVLTRMDVVPHKSEEVREFGRVVPGDSGLDWR